MRRPETCWSAPTIPRVLALSDGVFAVVITLLVLEIHVPELTQGHSLAEALEEVRPSFNASVVTFILTGMYWVGHRDLFALIRRTDRGLVWLNILYLLPVCLLPVGASLLGPYGREPTALHIYGLLLVAIAVMRVVIWWYAIIPGSRWPRSSPSRSRHTGTARSSVTSARRSSSFSAPGFAASSPRLARGPGSGTSSSSGATRFRTSANCD
jgi:uncharacterized membrane protein